MELTVLGRYAPFAAPGGACNGYLLRSGDTALLVDGGPGALARLQEHLPVEKLTAVVLTHFHPDHYADFHSLRYLVLAAQRLGRLKGPLKLYGPPRPRGDAYQKDWEAGRDWVHAADRVEFASYDPRHPLQFGNITLRLARTKHTVPAYAMRAEAPGQTFFFSADSSLSDGLVEHARDADLVLAEASLLEADGALRRLGHMTARDAAQLAVRSGAKRLLLTHLYPTYELDRLLAEAQSVFPAAELAVEGRSYIV